MTLKAGLIGSGIQASLTPIMHMTEGRQQGFDYRYAIIDLNEIGGGANRLAHLISKAENDGYSGLNITYPSKQQVLGLLDSLSEDAEKLGAVNTVVLKDGKRHGHNTDCSGFAEGFRRGLPGADLSRVLQVGAGGAGAATAFAILELGTQELVITDRELDRAEQLASSMRKLFPAAKISAGVNLEVDIKTASGVIHATPTGMAKYPGLPIPAKLLRPELWISEIVYFPLETQLLSVARDMGCRVLDGGGMAVFQAVGAFRLFAGQEPDIDRMLAHFASLTATPEISRAAV